MRSLRLFLLLSVCLALCLTACSRAPRSTKDVPRVLSHQYSVAVMPFTQPTTTGELIAGRLPIPQGLVPEGYFAYLDGDLQELLQSKKNSRNITYVAAAQAPRMNPMHFRTASQPSGLATWVAAARKSGRDFILVPQVLDWHEREGNEASVARPAHVRLEMYLIRTGTGTVQSRAIYEEEQQGLVDNLLSVGNFVQRRGAWVNARHLAKDGMANMLKELGL